MLQSLPRWETPTFRLLHPQLALMLSVRHSGGVTFQHDVKFRDVRDLR